MWEGTTSRMLAANRPCDESSDFYSVRPEYFGLKDLKYRMIKSLFTPNDYSTKQSKIF
jgi:hypothetical protein